VEKIIRQIQQDISDAGEAVPELARDVVTGDDDLRVSLADVNARCLIGRSDVGLKGVISKVIRLPLGSLLAEINGFNASVVRVLNGQMRVLEGKDETISSELIGKQQQRIDLMRKLEERVAALETRIEELTNAGK